MGSAHEGGKWEDVDLIERRAWDLGLKVFRGVCLKGQAVVVGVVVLSRVRLCNAIRL